MSVLVTGGAGYIGSVAVEHLCDAGHHVVVYDNLYKGHKGAVDPRAHFVEGDLADLPLLEETLRAYKVDAVMHFAAHSLVGESMENPVKYFDNNVSASLNLVEAMEQVGVQHTRLFFVCGHLWNAQRQYHQRNRSAGADQPLRRVKADVRANAAMVRFAQRLEIRFTTLFQRCRSLGKYGEVHDPETHLIPIVLQVALGQRPFVQIFGDDYPTPDGTAVRDYIHVIDLANAHSLALNWLSNGGESCAFNLGNGEGFSVKQVIETAREVTGTSRYRPSWVPDEQATLQCWSHHQKR